MRIDMTERHRHDGKVLVFYMFIVMLTASIRKHNVTVWRPSVHLLSVPSAYSLWLASVQHVLQLAYILASLIFLF